MVEIYQNNNYNDHNISPLRSDRHVLRIIFRDLHVLTPSFMVLLITIECWKKPKLREVKSHGK